MKGRPRGHPPSSSSSSSPAAQRKTRMALRKQKSSDISSEKQQMEEDGGQEDEASGSGVSQNEFSLSLLGTTLVRKKRWRERENKAKPKEMTEEEMMDLALHLSKQEANDTAHRRQQEEESVMKAIQQSMVDLTQPCRPSQTLLSNTPPRPGYRRKLTYANQTRASDSEDGCRLRAEVKPGDEDGENKRTKKRKQEAGSPLLEMPDLSQTQKISEVSPGNSQSPSAHPEFPQSSDSTHIEDSEHRLSPFFPQTGSRARVQVNRLNQDLLHTCRKSGFVSCSQDSLDVTQRTVQPKSPTFPQSNPRTCSRSPVLYEDDGGDDGEMDMSPKYIKSPVFGKSTQHEMSLGGHKPETSVFAFSSQDSLTPSVRPQSPVFPRSPNSLPPSEPLPVHESPDQGQSEQSHKRPPRPVFRKTAHRQAEDQRLTRSVAKQRGSGGDGGLSGSRRTSSRRDDKFTMTAQSKSGTVKCGADELKETSDRDSAETDLTSDMTLVWSDFDEDGDVTPTGSPSPVFLEERPNLRAGNQTASLNHDAEASPDKTRPDHSIHPLSMSVEQSGSSRSGTSPLSGGGAGGQTVLYYWGVPFCPQGLDPNMYTQVILAQMDVYKKSLKRARRCLLRKAEWGEAILPQPEVQKSSSPESSSDSPQRHNVSRRRGLRLRRKRLSEPDETAPTEAEEEEEKDKEEEEDDKEQEEEEENKEAENEEEKNEDDEARMEADDCDVCPETPPSNNSTQDLMMVTDSEAQRSPKSPELPELAQILHSNSHAADRQLEEVSNDDKSEGEVGRDEAAGKQEVREDPEESKDLQRSTSPELVPCSPQTSVDCPICQASFPASRIEMHAAYCDGEVSVVEERRPRGTLGPRRTRTRRAETTVQETNNHFNTGKNQEKCYICKKAIPLKDYSQHTDLCVQRQPPKTATRRSLISALSQTERRDSDAEPSGSKLQQREVIVLCDDEDEEGEVFRSSSSPITSFISISEATDCLIDFNNPLRAKKPSQRR
ncbi:uncharacterized protein uimc1 isoform 2-T2 [Pholidichthys leucotaenia]